MVVKTVQEFFELTQGNDTSKIGNCANGSPELVNINCKHIITTSAMYISRGSHNIRYC